MTGWGSLVITDGVSSRTQTLFELAPIARLGSAPVITKPGQEPPTIVMALCLAAPGWEDQGWSGGLEVPSMLLGVETPDLLLVRTPETTWSQAVPCR